MQITWIAHSIAKFGNRQEENEDVFWPSWNYKIINRKREFRCAISDGATQTSFSSLWARLLVETIGRSKKGITQQDLAFAQYKWSAIIASMSLPWHAEEKVKQGSYATLVWFRIRQNQKKPGGNWLMSAVGDSCIFHIRNGANILSYPIMRSSEFGNNPILLSSLPTRNSGIWECMSSRSLKGDWQNGDQFLLMTDALAMWFLKTYESGLSAYDELGYIVDDHIPAQGRFEEWINRLRSEHSIRNDDTTIIWIKISRE